MRAAVLALGAMLVASPAWADVHGRVVDLATNAPIAGAWVKAGTASAVAGSDGRFQVATAVTVDLVAGATGYGTTTLHHVEPDQEVLVRLIASMAEAAGQTFDVTAEKPKIDTSPTVSSFSIEHGAVDKTPGSLEDVTRAISLKPGIVPASDFAPVLFVRGGDATQTFFFLDDVLIYNPFQPVGGGTIFNPDLVDSADLYTGGQLASFPEALSGLISIQYKEPERERHRWLAEASAISVNLRAEGPGPQDKVGLARLAPDGWLVSARRSDYEPLLAAIKPALGSQDIAAPVFLDLFAKGAWDLSSRDSLDVNAMSVDNALAHFTYKSQAAARDDRLFFSDRQRLAWARWTHVIGADAAVKSNVSHVEDLLRASSTGTDPLAVNVDSHNDAVRQDLSVAPETGTAWDAGWYVDRAQVALVGKVGDFRRIQPNVAIGGDPNLPLVSLFPKQAYVLFGAYVQYKRTLDGRLTVQPGVRLGWNDATHELNVGPRLNASLSLSQHHVVKAAWGIFSEAPINPVLLDPNFGNPNLKSERAIHWVLGWEGEPLGDADPLHAKIEAYYKDEYDLVMPQDFSTVNFTNPSAADIAKLRTPFLNAGTSAAWGAEISIVREVAQHTRLELAYSLLKVTTTNPLIANPANRTFAPYQDQRHTLNLVADWRVNEDWSFAATGRFGSGKPYTPIDSFRVEPDQTSDVGPRDIWVPDQLGALNSARYPVYARLDLRAERRWTRPNGVHITAFAELINAQIRRNTEFIGYTAGDPDSSPPQPPVRQDVLGLPTIPYVGIRLEN